MLDVIRGKWAAARSLTQFIWWFRNWRPVWSAYRKSMALPPLEVRGGPTLHHTAGDDPILLFREIFVDQCYTRGGFYHPKPTDIVVDIGANIGMATLYLDWLAPGIRIHCFEPARETRSRLIQNIAARGLTNSVTVYPVAVSGHSGVLKLLGGGNSGHRSVVASAFASEMVAEDVECLTLEAALTRCGVDRVDLLKIDVEGSETDILEAASPTILGRADRVAVEFHNHIRPNSLDVVLNAVKAAGFTRVDVEYATPTLGLVRAQK